MRFKIFLSLLSIFSAHALAQTCPRETQIYDEGIKTHRCPTKEEREKSDQFRARIRDEFQNAKTNKDVNEWLIKNCSRMQGEIHKDSNYLQLARTLNEVSSLAPIPRRHLSSGAADALQRLLTTIAKHPNSSDATRLLAVDTMVDFYKPEDKADLTRLNEYFINKMEILKKSFRSDSSSEEQSIKTRLLLEQVKRNGPFLNEKSVKTLIQTAESISKHKNTDSVAKNELQKLITLFSQTRAKNKGTNQGTDAVAH